MNKMNWKLRPDLDHYVKALIFIARMMQWNIPEEKKCYYNCQFITWLSEGKIKYCEGYYTINGQRLRHAWCKIEEYYFDLTFMILAPNAKTMITDYEGAEITDHDEFLKACMGEDGLPTGQTLIPISEY